MEITESVQEISVWVSEKVPKTDAELLEREFRAVKHE